MTQQEILAKLYKTEFGAFAPPVPVTGLSAVPCAGLVFQVVTSNTTVASITINGTAITSFAGVTLPSGFCFYGIISSVTLGVGTGIVYTGNVTDVV